MCKALVLLPLPLLLAGCGYVGFLTPPPARPIIEDHAANQVNTFAVAPSRRMVIVKSNINHNGDHAAAALDGSGLLKDNAVLVCSEASPDVSDDVASSLAAALSGKGPAAADKASAAEIGASYATALATTGQALFKRSQALQFYRDGAYHLCQAKINGFMKDAEFRAAFASLTADAKELLKDEIPWLYISQTLTAAQQAELRKSFQNKASSNATVVVKGQDGKTVLSIEPAASAEAGGTKAGTQPADKTNADKPSQ